MARGRVSAFPRAAIQAPVPGANTLDVRKRPHAGFSVSSFRRGLDIVSAASIIHILLLRLRIFTAFPASSAPSTAASAPREAKRATHAKDHLAFEAELNLALAQAHGESLCWVWAPSGAEHSEAFFTSLCAPGPNTR